MPARLRQHRCYGCALELRRYVSTGLCETCTAALANLKLLKTSQPIPRAFLPVRRARVKAYAARARKGKPLFVPPLPEPE